MNTYQGRQNSMLPVSLGDADLILKRNHVLSGSLSIP